MPRSRRATSKRRAPARPRPQRPAPPAGFRTVTPYLEVVGASKAVEFYKSAFGARELTREMTGEGKVLHARLRIGDSIVMLSDVFEEAHRSVPATPARSPVTLHLYVPDVDLVWNRAIAAGARSIVPLDDMFWGERYGQLLDPFGHRWSLSMRIPMSKRERDAKRLGAMKMLDAGEPPGRPEP